MGSMGCCAAFEWWDELQNLVKIVNISFFFFWVKRINMYTDMQRSWTVIWILFILFSGWCDVGSYEGMRNGSKVSKVAMKIHRLRYNYNSVDFFRFEKQNAPKQIAPWPWLCNMVAYIRFRHYCFCVFVILRVKNIVLVEKNLYAFSDPFVVEKSTKYCWHCHHDSYTL